MGSWSNRGQKHRLCLLQCLAVVHVFVSCCTGISGDGLDCPSSLLTNGAQLKIISRKNHTQRHAFHLCGASLETICFRDLELEKCRTLLNLSVNLVAEAQDDWVELFEFHLLQALPFAGNRRDVECDVADLGNDLHSLDKVQNVNWWLDYECCDEAQGLETYAAILSVYYNKSRTCKARAYVKLTSENEEARSPIIGESSENTSAESGSVKEDEDDRASEATSLVGVVAAVVIAVVGAIVTVVVFYIVYVKCSNGHSSNSQSEQTPLQHGTPENCHTCDIERFNIDPPEEDCVSCSTVDTSVIPTVTFSSSDEQIDSGCFESGLTDAARSIIK